MSLSPTERLTIYVLRGATAPVSLAALTTSVGSTPSTMLKIVHQLVDKGYLHRERIDGITHYSVAPEVQG